MQILIRVDTLVDDSELRKKCKWMKITDFTTADFGVSQDFQLT